MKFSSTLLTTLLGLVAFVQALPPKASYDGTKVMRIDLGASEADAQALEALIKKLDLPMWTDVVIANTHVDVEVPKGKFAAFQKGTKDFKVSVMHEDLGASIRAESEVDSASRGKTSERNVSWNNS